MQLKQRRAAAGQSIRGALTSATCALLGATAPVVAQADSGSSYADAPWQVDSALMIYSETDRVSAIEPVVNLHRQLDDDNTVDVKLVLDVLTGASPNGATPTDEVQTFTRPSGSGSYTVAPGETPLDDTFQDTRVSAGAVLKRNLDRFTRGSLGGNVSKEYDFTSVALSTGLERDFNNRNTTLSAGIGVEYDQIEPEGNIPTPFASMAAPGDPQPRERSKDDKLVTDLLVGVTQVINRRMLMQFNYSITNSEGYHTDPFKIISVVDDTPGPTLGDTVDYVYENRPDSRLKQALYWQTKYHLSEDVIDFSYRYMTDDWAVNSHTFDLRYRYMLGEGSYLEPHFRYYLQDAAEFYVHSLRDGEPLPEYASADSRLGEFDATTIGLKYSRPVFGDQRFGARVEFYQQDGDGSPDDAIGSQRSQDLFPDLDAWIVQFNYSFLW